MSVGGGPIPGWRRRVSRAALRDTSSCCRWSVLSRQYLRSSTAGRESGKSAGRGRPSHPHTDAHARARPERRTPSRRYATLCLHAPTGLTAAAEGQTPGARRAEPEQGCEATGAAVATRGTVPHPNPNSNTNAGLESPPWSGELRGVAGGSSAAQVPSPTSDDAEELLDAQARVRAVEEPLCVAAPAAQRGAGLGGRGPGGAVLQEHLAQPADHSLDPLLGETRWARGAGTEADKRHWQPPYRAGPGQPPTAT